MVSDLHGHDRPVCLIAKQGENTMAESINWETNLENALSRGNREGKLVLLDFYNPG
jgi:hypothetical protein